MELTLFEQLRVVFENAATQLTASGGNIIDVRKAAQAIDKISKIQKDFEKLDPKIRFAVRLAFEKNPPVGTKKARLPTEAFAFTQFRCLRNKLYGNDFDEPTREYVVSVLKALTAELMPEAMRAAAERMAA